MTRLPPGPSLPGHIQTILALTRPVWFIQRCHRRFGEYFTLRLWGGQKVLTSDPAGIAAILAASDETATADNSVLRPLLGDRSVLMLEGEEHLRHRRILLPYFHGEPMRQHGPRIEGIANGEIDRWPLAQPFPVLPSMRRITREVIMGVVLGLDDTPRLRELRQGLEQLISLDNAWMVHPWVQRDLGRFSPWGIFLRRKARVDELLMEEIRRRRHGGGAGRGDVLSQLVQVRSEQGEVLTDGELRDEIMTMLIAGHETTAISLAWCVDLLMRRPDLVARAREELEQGSQVLLDGILRETLRLRPIFETVFRYLHQPLQVGPYLLPAGVSVGISVFDIHRRPDLYPDAEAICPERYAEGSSWSRTWLPFGGGVRRCLGASFALFEMGVVMKAVLKRTRLRPVSPHPESIATGAVTLAPKHGARVIVDRILPRDVPAAKGSMSALPAGPSGVSSPS